jgi:hypothetical protein
MEPEDIINLLESDRIVERKKGLKELYNLLIPIRDQNQENSSKSLYQHTKLWKTIRRRTWDGDEADEIITNFFIYIVRRFKTEDSQILTKEERYQEKAAPSIKNLEAFAFWKCGLLITDYERKMGKQREKEIVTDLDLTILTTEDLESNNQKEILDCIQTKLREFGKEKSPEGAEIIGMQLSGTPIKEIAKFRKKSLSATKEYIRVSKNRARSYLAPCNKINTYSKAIKKLRKN